MNRKKNLGNPWVGLNTILPTSLQQAGVDRTRKEDWVSLCWDLAVGREIAAVSKVFRVTPKTLFIQIAGKEWIPVLQGLKDKILKKLKRQAGMEQLTRIQFKEGPVSGSGEIPLPPSSENPVPAKSRPLQNMPKEAEGNMDMIKDANLKEIITRVSRKIRWTPIVLLGGLFLSNCSGIPVSGAPASEVNLSSSYAQKNSITLVTEKRISPKTVHHNPLAYYHYLMALKAEQNFKFAQAAKHYREVVKYDPKMQRMHERLAILLLRSGNFEGVEKSCREGLSQFPNNVLLNMMMGSVLSSQGKYEESLPYFQKVIGLRIGGSRGYLLLGTTYEQLKQFDKAQETFKKLVLADPSNPLGQYYLGRTYLRSGNFQEAAINLEKSVSLRPNFLQAREHLAWVLNRVGKKEEAIREYKLLLKLNPGNKRVRKQLENLHQASSGSQEELPRELTDPADVHMIIGGIFYEQALYLKALEEFQLALAQKVKKEPLTLLARIYEILGRLDKAIQQFETLRELRPGSVDVLRYMARLYSLDNRPENAIAVIKKAIEIQPENDSLYHLLSLAYMTVEKFDLAIENMHTAITLNDHKDSYYFELGALLERSGQVDSAIQNMERAIEINPMHSNAHNFLGYMYALEGQYLDKALTHLKKALSIQPRNGYFLDSLGWIYFKKGNSKKALREIKKAMVYTPPDPVLYDHLGDIQFSLKNYNEASGAWKTSLSLTRVKKDDANDSEMPDPKNLKEKIEKVEKILRGSL